MIKISAFDPEKAPKNSAPEQKKASEALPSSHEDDLQILDSTVEKLSVIDPSSEQKLRVYITGGGCSGFKYCFKLEADSQPDDTILERSGKEVIIDPMSMTFLGGAKLEWREDLEGARFMVTNDHVATTCSCGASFSLV